MIAAQRNGATARAEKVRDTGLDQPAGFPGRRELQIAGVFQPARGGKITQACGPGVPGRGIQYLRMRGGAWAAPRRCDELAS